MKCVKNFSLDALKMQRGRLFRRSDSTPVYRGEKPCCTCVYIKKLLDTFFNNEIK